MHQQISYSQQQESNKAKISQRGKKKNKAGRKNKNQTGKKDYPVPETKRLEY
jgi:hypothetical protein